MAERNDPYPVAELLRAVRSEIATVLNDDMAAAEKLSLQSGRQIERSGEHRTFLFACKSWRETFASKNLLIRGAGSRAPWAQAEITRMPDGKVRVVTTADLGDRPQGAQLVEDDTVNLEAIADRLAQTRDRACPVNLTAAGWLLNRGRPKTVRCTTPDSLIRDYRERRLNQRQRAAVEQALGSEATFIWGPPGTGKTDVVASIVEGCFRQDLRVLFLAPTHVAVDQALERMCKLLSDEQGFDSGLVQRAGEIALPSLSADYGDQIVPERIAARLATTIDTEIARLKPQLDGVRSDLAVHEEAARLTAELGNLRVRLRGIDQAIAEGGQGERDAYAHMTVLQQKIAQSGTPTGLFAQRKQAKLDELYREHAAHQRACAVFQQRLATARMDRQRILPEIAEAEAQLTPLRARLPTLPPADRLRELTRRFQERLSLLQDERQRLTATVRSQCRVMGTTVSKAVQSRQLMDQVDVVIIDEAGMVNLPSAWCAAGLADKRIVVAGDFRQLPAVTRGSKNRKATADDRTHSQEWMDRDAFHAAGLVDAQGRVRPDPRMVSLNEQYRMRPAICAVVNAVAYPDEPLITGRGDESELPSSPLIESPLVLIDTSSRQIAGGSGRETHKSNPVHEAVIHELVRGLQYDKVLPARKSEESRPDDLLAVISPYKRQKIALNASLKYRFGEEYEGLVDTVHRFQGSQRRLVVIDTVAGAGSKVGYFYEGVGLSSDTCRLLNVALSRAQDHLIVVANVDFMRRKLSPSSEAAQMLDFLQLHARPLPVDDLVPIRAAADLGGLDAEELARPAFFPADEVARAVEWDIGHARQSIDIYCAFLSATPTRKWLRHLQPRAAAGIRVTVHTRQAEPGSPAARCVQDLQAIGCQVAARERMHEKVMIIDDKVLWHGSLNLLAHTGSTDLMMRITDPSSCERVRRIVERARMDRPARTPPPNATQRTPRPSGDVSPGDVMDGRLYLMVPYEEKDDAKAQVKARWDKTRRLWHVDANVPRERVQRWLPAGD